ncbi:MAG: iron-sulfur cluster assembly protein [bacterium]|nr:iron-sulfur cluster assembly protein [bacterium]
MTCSEDQNTSAEFLPPPLIPTDNAEPADNPPAHLTAETAASPASSNTSGSANGEEKAAAPTADGQFSAGQTAPSEATAKQNAPAAAPELSTSADSSDSSESEPFPTEDEIRQAIYDVVDPEINISIIDLGLVYDIIPNPADRSVHINMTLTSPGCPLGPEITTAVYLKVTRMPGVRDCQVDLVWSPMWDPMVHPTEETRMALGIW